MYFYVLPSSFSTTYLLVKINNKKKKYCFLTELAAVYPSVCVPLALLPSLNNSIDTRSFLCLSVVEWLKKTWTVISSLFSFYVWNLCAVGRENTPVVETISASTKTKPKHIVRWGQWQSRSSLMHFALPLLNYCFIAFRAFVPLEAPPSQNSTQWEKVQYLFEELGSSRKYIILPVIFSLVLIFIVVLIMTIGFYFFYLRLIHSFHLTPSISHIHYSLEATSMATSIAPIHSSYCILSCPFLLSSLYLSGCYPVSSISVMSKGLFRQSGQQILDWVQLQAKQKVVSRFEMMTDSRLKCFDLSKDLWRW